MDNILLSLEMFSKMMSEEVLENQEDVPIDQIYSLLDKIEGRIKSDFYENKEKKEYLNENAKYFLRDLNLNNIVDEGYGLDYNLELIEIKPIISQNKYPLLFAFICFPGEKDDGLIKENHGMGYHIHYVVIQKRRK